MISIETTDRSVSIRGHAGYAPQGFDIVCSAISALTQTFVFSMEEFTSDWIFSDIEEGRAEIRFKNLSPEGVLLFNSFFLGITEVAQAYPRYVSINGASNGVGICECAGAESHVSDAVD